MRVVLRSSFYALCSLLLLGCGGGGGGGGGSDGGRSNGSFSVSPSTLTFSAATTTGTSIPPQRITGTISGVSAQTLFLNIQVAGNAVATVGDINITGPATGTANVYPITQGVAGPGSFSSVITVTACTTSVACTSGVIGTPQTVNVTYTVTGVKSSAASLAYQVADVPLAADLTKTFDVTGYPVQNWTVSSDVPWIHVSPGTGTTGASTSVSAALDTAAMESFTSGTYTGNVLLTPSAGAAVTVPVSLALSRVRVNYVSPYIASSNASGEVIIRGENLTRFPITGVRFGGVDATAYTVIGDTEIHATHPSLPAGSYDVNIVNGQNTRTRAALKVLDPVSYSYAALTHPGPLDVTIVCMVHDAERDSLLLGVVFNPNGINSSRLIRYSRSTGWSSAADQAIPAMGACALTRDGRRVLAGSLDQKNQSFVLAVSERDPLTLSSELRTFEIQGNNGEAYSMAVSNDGRAVITTGFRTGPITSYTPLRPDLRIFDPTFHPTDGVVESSGDGSLVLVGSWIDGLFRYDPGSGGIVRVTTSIRPEVLSINRSGDRVIVSHKQVYDRNLVLVGTLPDTTLAGAIAFDSMRAYTYDSAGTLRTFDVSAALNDGSFSEVLPAIAVPDSPGNDHSRHRMLITQDGRAAFIAASERVVVVPLP